MFNLNKKKIINFKNPWLFFLITFSLTWIFWIPAVLLNKSFSYFPVMLLVILGGIIGKVVPATLLPYLTLGKEGWIDYWQRAIDFKRIGWIWWLITILSPPLFAILGIMTDLIFGGILPSFEIIKNFLSYPYKILPFAFFILIYGPLPEELGWAGYELDRLQEKYNALISSLILGVFWGLWHLPLFFIKGSYQHDEVVLGSLRFWISFCPGIISLQILQTWIYNNTNRSTLTAIIIHFMVNFTGEILKLSRRQEYYRTLWTIFITIMIIFIWGYKSLTLKSKKLYIKN